MRHTFSALVITAALAFSVAIAAPASAATVAVTISCSGNTVVVTPNSVTVAVGDTINVTNNSGGATIIFGAIQNSPRTVNQNTTGPLVVVSASGFVTINALCGSFGNTGLQLVSNGSSESSSSASATVPAPTFEIALTPTDGTTCTSSGQSATGGTWLTLPGANDCTPPASKAGATLLGWSTTPNFPVAIAQRQVTNGWGTYETINSAGEITSVFIPAGRATFLSGANSLYAIWNK